MTSSVHCLLLVVRRDSASQQRSCHVKFIGGEKVTWENTGDDGYIAAREPFWSSQQAQFDWMWPSARGNTFRTMHHVQCHPVVYQIYRTVLRVFTHRLVLASMFAQLSIPTHAELQRHRLKFIKNHLKNSYMFRSTTIFRELQYPR